MSDYWIQKSIKAAAKEAQMIAFRDIALAASLACKELRLQPRKMSAEATEFNQAVLDAINPFKKNT